MSDGSNNNRTAVDYFKNSGSGKFVCGKEIVKRVNFINECDSSGTDINKK
jgi:hypothetical protein